MSVSRCISIGVAALLCSSALAMAGPAEPAHKDSCFFSTQFQNWKSPDAKTIYIRVTGNHYYRLDLAGSCSALRSPGAFLITKFRGSNTVCSAVDWDLKVARGQNDIAQSCIVKKMTELTPKEAAAIPKKFKP